MATVNVLYSRPLDGAASVEGGYPRISENISTTGTSAATTGAASNGEVATVTVDGGNVRIAMGAAPTAGATSILLIDGQTRNFSILPGHKVAAIDA